MPIKLNGATNGSVELNVPDAVGSDLQMTLPATAGEIVVKDSSGNVGSGNVGIGTTPKRHLHIHEPTSATVGMMLTNSDTGASNDSQGFQLKVGSDTHAEIAQMENSNLRFLTNANERMRIHSDGEVTKSAQPAFNARMNAHDTVSIGIGKLADKLTSGHTFTNIGFNTGSCYDSTNTRFTAPVDGIYVFTENLSTSSSAAATAYLGVEFYKNGSRVSTGWRRSSSAGYQRVTATVVLSLSENDTVEPGIETAQSVTLLGGNTTGSHYTCFMGYLLH